MTSMHEEGTRVHVATEGDSKKAVTQRLGVLKGFVIDLGTEK